MWDIKCDIQTETEIEPEHVVAKINPLKSYFCDKGFPQKG